MSINIRSQMPDYVLADALPALEFIVQEEHQAFKTIYDKVMNVKQMRTSIAQSSQVSSLQPAGAVGEAEQIPLQRIYNGYSKTYTAIKYGVMLATSQELIDDMEYDVMSKNPARLTRAMMSTVESLAADIFNNGFSAAGPDGLPLFSASHPLLAPGAGLSSNLVAAADLSSTSFKTMLTTLRNTKDSGGNRVMIDPQWLLVAPDNQFTAVEILQSVLNVDAANASVNALNSIQDQYGVKPIVWDYLTDADAYFCCAKPMDNQLCFYWRKRPELSSDFDYKTEVALMKLVARFTAGFSDWRGVVGNAGI
jgi:hypothetical protein